MGCDIHAFAERKRKNGKWVQIKGEFSHKYKDHTEYRDDLDLGRNYELFAFLADVRNSNNIVPIAQPKGVPADASLGYQAEVEYWGSDGHSHSYFTLKELKEIPEELINQEIDDSSLILAKNGDEITETCSWTSGKHLGVVGKRKIFTLFKREKNPIEQIIEELKLTDHDEEDEDVRLVFFFDN